MQRRTALIAAVRGLSELERQCLRLRYEGYTLREIGETVGRDKRRVAELLERTTKQLQEKIGD
jgi:RNA polymerase sigma factor (sigma-70 family)